MTAHPSWYPDPAPEGEGKERFWDGQQWTDQVRPIQSVSARQAPTRDPDAIWQSVGKPLSGIGAGKYKLTSQYLFFEKGTLRTDSQQVPISQLLDVDVKQSMAQKARGVGTIFVHIQRAQGVEVVALEDVPDFRDGQRLINETSHAARLAIQRRENTMRYEGTHPTAPAAQSAPQAPPPAGDPMAMLQKLGQLRDAGILTDEEFQSKKAEILSRL
jgi:hypothetical protein